MKGRTTIKKKHQNNTQPKGLQAVEKDIAVADSSPAEETLKKEVRWFRLMADALPVLISYVDPDQRYVFNNKAYETFFGHSSESIRGRHIKDILGEKTYNNGLKNVEEALSGKHVFFDRWLHNRDGAERFMHGAYVPDLGENGEVKGFFVLADDITDRVKTEESLRLCSKRLVALEEDERKRLAQDLHDKVGQNLTALGINLNIMRAKISREDEALLSRVDDSISLLDETADCIRNVMTDLRNQLLEDHGLTAALRWYCEQFSSRTAIKVEIIGGLDQRLPNHVESALFRIVQEALTNVAKHAHALQVKLLFESGNGIVRLSIRDNGQGFSPGDLTVTGPSSGWGLSAISERVDSIGGCFRIESGTGQGTGLIVEAPL